jgi:hypothetical protein
MGLTPALLSDDATDLLLTDTELGSQILLPDSSLAVTTPDFFDLRLGKPMKSVILSRVVGLPHAVLANGISHVVGLSTEEPMCIILAGPEIARMADLEVIRDWSDAPGVSPSVSTDHTGATIRVVGSVPELSVPLQFWMSGKGKAGPGPGPAFVGLTDTDLRPVPIIVSQLLSLTHNSIIEHVS